MCKRLHYSPQVQLDLDEIFDVDRVLYKRRDFASLLGQ